MIGPVSPADAVRFVSERHYSGSAVPGTVRFGWYDEAGRLIGVSIYNPGPHATRCGVFGPAYATKVLHHHRLALEPGAPKCTASQFIGACNRELAKMGYWAVVTYADLCQGHTGTIYRATNALLTGVQARGNVQLRHMLDGTEKSLESLKRYGSWSVRRAVAERLGYEEYRCKGKARYVYLLGTAKQRRSRPPMLWPVLDYSEILVPRE